MRIRTVSKTEDRDLVMNHCVKYQQSEAEYPIHTHNGYELLFLKKGDIFYEIGEESIPVRRNSLVITRPQTPHRIRPDFSTEYDRYNIILSPMEAQAEILAKIPENIHVLHFEGNGLVTALFEKMDYYCRMLPGDAGKRMVKMLTEELLWNVALQLESPLKTRPQYRHPMTQTALDLIEERLVELGSVEALCDALGISKSYLYQIFQEDLNTTPKAWLTQRRLKLARREIFLGAKATVIYSFCGFQDYSSFFRAYKKQFGYSPSQTLEYAFRESGSK